MLLLNEHPQPRCDCDRRWRMITVPLGVLKAAETDAGAIRFSPDRC
jgi:hypothetical protein